MQMKVAHLEEHTGVMRTDLAEIKESVSRMEIAVNDVEDIKEEYSNMEKSLRELSALYDLLSSYTNPFIENIDLPKRSGAASEPEEKEAAKNASSEDEDIAMEFEELSSDINPFVDDMDTKKGSRKKEDLIQGEPAVDINRDFWMLKWAKYISAKVRPSQVHKLLDYYRELGWIDKDIEEKMLTYFDGSKLDSQGEDMFDSDTIITEDGKVITEESEDAWKMSMDDHSKSLEFIGKIKSDSPIESK
jgi:archaellum component FlaD/FlaE